MQPSQLIFKGDEYLNRFQLDEAEQCYREALRLSPSDQDAICSLGCVELRRNNPIKAAAFARQALSIDSGYRHAKYLLANAYNQMEKNEQALAILLPLNLTSDEPGIYATIGLIYERMQKWREAEHIFREVLEKTSLSYQTCMATIGMHDYDPFNADLLHALGRVMQRQGNVKQAWLYYHLAKRNDSHLQIHPMYLQILKPEDLENHPYFDAQEVLPPNKGSELPEILLYLVGIKEYKTLVTEITEYGLQDKKGMIAELIRQLQREGRLSFTAQLRVIGDLLDGQDATVNFRLVKDRGLSTLFQLAEKLFSKEISKQEALTLAGRVDISHLPPCPLTYFLTRFIRIHSPSSYPILLLFEAAARQGRNPELITLAAYTLGICCYKLEQYRDALQSLEIAALGLSVDASHEFLLPAFDYYCRCLVQQKKAHMAIERSKELVELTSGHENYVTACCLYADVLQWSGRIEEAYLVLLDTADNIATDQLTKKDGKLIAEGLHKLSLLLNKPLPPSLQSLLAAYDTRTIEQQLQKVATLMGAGKTVEACTLLEELIETALSQNQFPDLPELYYHLGQVRLALDDKPGSEAAFEAAVSYGELYEGQIKLWPIYLSLSDAYAKQDDKQTEALQFAEKSLEDAIRFHDNEGKSECHLHLALLLRNTDPTRALQHMDDHMQLGTGKIGSSDFEKALQLMKQGAYDDAIPCLLPLLDNDTFVDQKPLIFANLAIAHRYTGRQREAADYFQKAAQLFAEAEEFSHAIQMYKQLTLLVEDRETILSVLDTIQSTSTGIQNQGVLRSFLTEAASLAADVIQIAYAQRWAELAISIAASGKWKNIGDEIECRSTLGRVYRIISRYQEAVEQYEKALLLCQATGNKPLEGRIRGWKAVAHRYLRQLDLSLLDFKEAIRVADYYRQFHDAAQHRLNFSQALLEAGEKANAKKVLFESLVLCCEHHYDNIAVRVVEAMDSVFPLEELSAELRQYVTSLNFELASDPVVAQLRRTKTAMDLIKEGRISEGAILFEQILHNLQNTGDRFNEIATYLNKARAFTEVDSKQAERDALTALELSENYNFPKLALKAEEFFLRGVLSHHDEGQIRLWLSRFLSRWDKLRAELPFDEQRITFANSSMELVEDCLRFFLLRKAYTTAFHLAEYSGGIALGDMIVHSLDNPNQFSYGLPDQMDHIDALLDNSTGVLRILNLNDQYIAFSYRKGWASPVVTELGIEHSFVLNLLQEFQDETYHLKGRTAHWQQKARSLIEPIFPYLDGCTDLFLLAEEELQVLPFGAVPVSDDQLLQDFVNISYLPSLSVLAKLEQRKEQTAPTIGLPLLSIGIAFPEEALAVTQVLSGQGITGNQISKDGIRTMLENRAIVHFSCHGHFDHELPRASGLHLRNPSSFDQAHILMVKDLEEWHFKSGLVVLSACETGVGQAQATEYVSLARSLLGAGAGAVIVALWPVKVAATKDFMILFYTNLRSEAKQNQKMNIAAILARTQREFAEKEPIYDWAAFKLIGSPTLETPLILFDKND